MPSTEQSRPARECINRVGSDAADSFNTAIDKAAERGADVLDVGLEAWSRETERFHDELSIHGATALEQLKACQSAIDVLGVEQAWLAARSKTYLESGLRFAQAFATIAQSQKMAASVTPSAPAAPSGVA
jgi:hypothetical protein